MKKKCGNSATIQNMPLSPTTFQRKLSRKSVSRTVTRLLYVSVKKIDISILTTLNVVSLGVPHVIAKAISSDHGTVLEKIGAEVVYPERDMALRLGKRLIANNNFLDFISLSNEVEIQQIPVTDRIAGISVERLDIRRKYGLNIIAIESNGNTETEISPEYRIRRDDILVVIGKMDNIWKFEHEI